MTLTSKELDDLAETRLQEAKAGFYRIAEMTLYPSKQLEFFVEYKGVINNIIDLITQGVFLKVKAECQRERESAGEG
jgi:hypothetical protein